MAYRRRQGIVRASTFKDESLFHPRKGEDGSIFSDSKLTASHTFTTSSSLAAQAIKASAAHHDSSLSSAYVVDSAPQSFRSNKVSAAYDDHSSSRNETSGFWGVVARKAKAILDDDDVDSQLHNSNSSSSRFDMPDHSSRGSSPPFQGFKKMDNPKLHKGLNKITSSLNHIGDTFEKAFEEGRTIVENKTANIIQETRKLQVRRQGSGLDELHNKVPSANNSSWQPLTVSDNPRNHETQLKASRDVAMATAAKAKLLLRELKTVKADLAFAKLRCSQLEEENKGLRESREKGGNHADDDLIRLQLETLLAEKVRLAHENSQYARENRFLREIVEYHQLTMQDVIYMDEGSEEVTEVYMLSMSPAPPASLPSPPDTFALESQLVTKDVHPTHTTSIQKMLELPPTEVQQNVVASMPEQAEAETVLSNKEEDDKRASNLKKDCAEITSS